jgi:hypothetical protein
VGNDTSDTLSHNLRNNAEFRELSRDAMAGVAEAVLVNAIPKPKRRIMREKAKSLQLQRKQREEQGKK